MKYRKKPVVIEAFQYGIDPRPDWFIDKVSNNDIITYCEAGLKPYCEIKTLEGIMRCNWHDFVIQGVNGEVYPCKPNIFVKTYVAVEEKD